MRHGARLGLLALAACAPESAAPEGTARPADGAPADWFEERSRERGLVWRHRAFEVQRFDFPEIMGGGVALLDAENDGDLDVLFVDSGDLRAPRGKQAHHRFFENDGAGRFTDATARAGFGPTDYGMGAACGDYDHDGDVDVFVTAVGRTALFRNDGGRFTDATEGAHAGVDGWTASAGFWDHDLDGWLDLFVVRYVDWTPERELDCRSPADERDYCSPLRYRAPSASVLLRNKQDGTFEEISAEVGLDAARANGLGIAIGRFAAEGASAAFVANDMLPGQAWLRRGASLVEVGASAGVALNAIGFAASGMGIHAADVEDDGDLDLFVTHLRRQGHSLFLQGDGRRFRDEAARCGLLRPTLPFTGFGCGFADFDCDGDLDLFVANGRVALEQPLEDPRAPYAESNQLFEQTDRARFREVLPRGGVAGAPPGSSRAVALGDLDNDGGVDLVVVERDGEAQVLFDRAHRGRRWIGFRVLDENGRDACGARVELEVAGRSRFREVNPVYGYLTSNDPRVHFGLGDVAATLRLRVRWPDGTVEEFPAPEPGAYRVLARGKSR